MPEQAAEGTQTWTVRAPASLSLRAKAQAQAEGISLNAWVLRAAERELDRAGIEVRFTADFKDARVDPAIEAILGNRKASANLGKREDE